MSHYSLWLDRYKRNKEIILKNLKRYKAETEKIKEKISEEELILPPPANCQEIGKSCFVDGGEGIQELLGGAIYFIRASGLLWEDKGQKTRQDFLRSLDLGILRYDDHVTEKVGLLRAGMEFDLARKCVKEFSPEYLFLDGSLDINGQREIPGKEYEAYRKKFSRLLKEVKSKGVCLGGISEDSHSRLLLRHLSGEYGIKFPSFMTDCSFLKMLAGNKKFMSKKFLPEHRSGEFFTLYLQPTSLSTPLRVDVPLWEEDKIDNIISFITKLSKGSKNYGYPLPLYIVHLDAKIKKKHAYWNTKQIVHHIFKDDPELYGGMLREKRRDIRPKG